MLKIWNLWARIFPAKFFAKEIVLRAEFWVRVRIFIRNIIRIEPVGGWTGGEMGLGIQLANTEFLYWVWCVKRGGGT